MKKIVTILFVCLLCCTLCDKLHAQSYDDVLNYFLDSTPANGIKIKTNIPYQDGAEMPSIVITGYDYGAALPIGLTLVWYVYGGAFYNPSVSSWGGYTPQIYLSNENGYVSIFINDRSYYERFKIAAYAYGMSETSSWFQGWTAVDQPLGGANQVLVPYTNSFAGTVWVSGNLVVSGLADIQNLGIGTNNPSQKIDVADGNVLIEKNNGASAEYDIATRGIDTWKIRSDATVNDPQFQIMMNALPYLDIDASSGNVLIGKTAQSNPAYKLDVNGTIRANEVVVNTTGADFIFAPSYKLPPLSTVSKYIKLNDHLPGIPSAAEMQNRGLDMGAMQQKELQKIEELTLYLIKQQKIIENQQKQIEQQRVEIETVTDQLKDLKPGLK